MSKEDKMKPKIFNLLKTENEGPAFQLVDADGNDVGTFRCLPELPGYAVAALVSAASTEVGFQASAAVEFLQAAIHPDDERAFRRIITGKSPIITVETLTEVVEYLVEAYFQRPLPKSSGSQSGGSSTKTTSVESV